MTGTIQVRGSYTVHTSHPIYEILQDRYGQGRKNRGNTNRDNNLTGTDSD